MNKKNHICIAILLAPPLKKCWDVEVIRVIMLHILTCTSKKLIHNKRVCKITTFHIWPKLKFVQTLCACILQYLGRQLQWKLLSNYTVLTVLYFCSFQLWHCFFLTFLSAKFVLDSIKFVVGGTQRIRWHSCGKFYYYYIFLESIIIFRRR